MGQLFETAKAREQVWRILELVAYPGVACVLDADGWVVAVAGELPGLDAHDLASAFGAHDDAILGEAHAPCDLGGGFASFIRSLPGEGIGPRRAEVCEAARGIPLASGIRPRCQATGRNVIARIRPARIRPQQGSVPARIRPRCPEV